MPALHDDDLDADLVRALVADQLPAYADRSVEPLSVSGSTNALFRLGDDLLVRLPRQPGGSATIRKEARWQPVLAAGVTTTLPEFVALGEPGLGYPETWAVTRWVEGHQPSVPWDPATGGSDGLAHGLARLVAELGRVVVPAEARDDPALRWYRGGRLVDVDDEFRAAVAASRSLEGLDLDLDRCLDVWADALAAERGRQSRTAWCHGDLLAENLLVREGRLAAVLDLGALSVGDPTVDLVGAWEVLDRPGRAVFREAVGADDATWTRARGWALLIAMITFPYYWRTMPARCAHRRAMAAAVLAET